MVRGGQYFSRFTRALFLGSKTDGGSLEPRTSEPIAAMTFAPAVVVTTSPVQSLSHDAGFARESASNKD